MVTPDLLVAGRTLHGLPYTVRRQVSGEMEVVVVVVVTLWGMAPCLQLGPRASAVQVATCSWGRRQGLGQGGERVAPGVESRRQAKVGVCWVLGATRMVLWPRR